MDTQRKIVVTVILVIGIVGISGMVLYGLSLRVPNERESPQEGTGKPEVTPSTTSPTPPTVPDQSVIPQTNPFGLKIPPEVFYYTGTIKEISKDTITLTAAAKDNFLERDAELIIHIDENTRLEKYTVPLYLPPGKSPKDYKTGTGTLADFAVGDRVTVYAGTDIAGVVEFTASSVKAVEFSESGS